MKKQIITTVTLFAAITLFSFFAFKPALTPMQFQVIETRYMNVSPNPGGGWKFNFTMFYVVKDNPYNTKHGSDWNFAAYNSMVVISASTDTSVVYPIARDSANAYRLRTFPNVN